MTGLGSFEADRTITEFPLPEINRLPILVRLPWVIDEGAERQYVTAAAFSPDGKVIAFATGSAVVLYDRKTRRLTRLPLKFEYEDDLHFNSLSFTRNGALLIGAGEYHPASFVVWDLQRRKAQPYQEKTIDSQGARAALSDDQRLVALAHTDGTIQIRELSSKKLIRSFKGGSGLVLGVCWSADGKRVATCTHNDNVGIWNVADGKSEAVVTSHSFTVVRTPHGSSVAVGGVGKVSFVDFVTGTTKRAIALPLLDDGSARTAWAIAFCKDKKLMAVGSYSGEVTLWSLAEDKSLGTVKAHTGRIGHLDFCPSGDTLMSFGAGDKDVLTLWDVVSH